MAILRNTLLIAIQPALKAAMINKPPTRPSAITKIDTHKIDMTWQAILKETLHHKTTANQSILHNRTRPPSGAIKMSTHKVGIHKGIIRQGMATLKRITIKPTLKITTPKRITVKTTMLKMATRDNPLKIEIPTSNVIRIHRLHRESVLATRMIGSN